MFPVDPRLQRLAQGDVYPLAMEVSSEEVQRIVTANRMGIPFLPRIRRKDFVRCICVRCGHDFPVQVEAALRNRARCPSFQCSTWHTVNAERGGGPNGER